METVRIVGDGYIKLSRAVFNMRRGDSKLTILKNWHQPIKYKPGTELLHQAQGGPCGLFAVLQANLIHRKLSMPEGSEWDKDEQLILSMLDIFARISPYYVFCTSIDPVGKVFEFLTTQDREEAKRYLTTMNYLEWDQACLFLTVSLTFASGNLAKLELPPEPYIEADKNTTVALVWLIINGTTSTESLKQIEASGYDGISNAMIGLKVLRVRQKNLIGTWLNPTASLFVCLSGCHFFTVHVTESGLDVYDNLAKNVRHLAPEDYKAIHWQ